MSKHRVGCIEFLNEANKLGLTVYQYTQKLIKEEKIVNPTEVNRISKN